MGANANNRLSVNETEEMNKSKVSVDKVEKGDRVREGVRSSF